MSNPANRVSSSGQTRADNIECNASDDDHNGSFELRDRSEALTPVAPHDVAGLSRDHHSAASSTELLVPPNRRPDVAERSHTSRGEPETGLPEGRSSQAPERRSIMVSHTRSYNFNEIIKIWCWELSSWVIAFISIAGMIILLIKYDNKPSPDWPITINTVVSFLATILSMGLLFPVTEAIGQLKWLWYKTGRRMSDFEVFDEAGKGGWLMPVILCGRTRGRHLATVGALVIIFTNLIGTFSQLIIAYPYRWKYDENKILLSTSNHFTWKPTMAARSSMEAVLIGGDFPGHARISVEKGHDCDGFDMCDWPIYDTLAICSDCRDYSEALSYTCSKIEGGRELCGHFSYPDFLKTKSPEFHTGRNDAGSNNSGNFTFLTIHNHHGNVSSRIPSRQWPLNSFVLAYHLNDSDPPLESKLPVAMECLLYACVKRMKTLRINNTFFDMPVNDNNIFWGGSEVASSFHAIDDKTSGLLYDKDYTPHKADITIDIPALTTDFPNLRTRIQNLTEHSNHTFLEDSIKFHTDDTRYYIRDDSANRIAWMLDTRLNGSAVILGEDLRHRRADYIVPISDILASVPQQYSVVQNTTREMVENMTGALTIDLMSRGTRKNSPDTTGLGFRLKTHIHVRWGWIALPSVLTFAVAVLLLMTILKSIREKVPFWKSSSMITLLHDIEWADRESRITPQQSDMRARTKRVRMKLEGGAHLAVCGPRTRDQETN